MTTKDAETKIPRQDNPFRVLGIALIVDQRGIGANMVARYPTQPSSPINQNDDQEYSNDDLFFTLTAFQMAKLFRTKKSLANKPMVSIKLKFSFWLLSSSHKTKKTSIDFECQRNLFLRPSNSDAWRRQPR